MVLCRFVLQDEVNEESRSRNVRTFFLVFLISAFGSTSVGRRIKAAVILMEIYVLYILGWLAKSSLPKGFRLVFRELNPIITTAI
jgi:hypothetical protein